MRKTNKQRPIKPLETIFNTFQSSFKIDRGESDGHWTRDGHSDGQTDKNEGQANDRNVLRPCVGTDLHVIRKKRRETKKLTQKETKK